MSSWKNQKREARRRADEEAYDKRCRERAERQAEFAARHEETLLVLDRLGLDARALRDCLNEMPD